MTTTGVPIEKYNFNSSQRHNHNFYTIKGSKQCCRYMKPFMILYLYSSRLQSSFPPLPSNISTTIPILHTKTIMAMQHSSIIFIIVSLNSIYATSSIYHFIHFLPLPPITNNSHTLKTLQIQNYAIKTCSCREQAFSTATKSYMKFHDHMV